MINFPNVTPDDFIDGSLLDPGKPFQDDDPVEPEPTNPDEAPPVPEDEELGVWRCLECNQLWENRKVEEPGDIEGCIHDDLELLSPCCGDPVDRDIRFCPSCKEHV